MLKRNLILNHVILAMALVVGAGCNGCKQGSSTGGSGTGNTVTGNEIKIGEYGSLTGTTATFGQGTHNGIKLAIDEANAKGGVQNKQIVLVTEDDQSKPDVAQTVVTKLVTQDKVAAVLGEVASTRSMRGGAVCQQYGVPMISPSSTNPGVTKVGENVFRVCFTDDFQAAVAAKFAADQGWKSAAVFTDIKNDYSVGFAKFFSEEFKRLGGKVAGEQSYQEGDTDFKAQLNSLKGLNPEFVLVPGYYTEVGTIARQAKEVGLSVPLLGGDGWDSPELVPGAGTALEGAYFTDHYFSEELPDPQIKAFIGEFNKKYGAKPDALSALGYDAAKLLIDALGRAATLDSKGIREAIAQTKDFPGVTGAITIDENRNARKPALVYQVKGSSFKVVKTYRPEEIGK